jgi:hypothetical protein
MMWLVAVYAEREEEDSPVIGELLLRGRGITLKLVLEFIII